MSVRVMSTIWDKAAQYAGGELLVLLALADWANDQGRCWPSVPQIARKSRLAERQVYNILARLKKDGALSCTSGCGRGKRSEYVVNTANIAGFTKTEKPCTAVHKNPALECKSPRPPNRNNRHSTVIKPSPTPSETEGGRAHDPVEVEIERVQRECHFSDKRVRAAIVQAMITHLARGELDAAATADRMIGNWREYVRLGEFLRFTWGPPKFFSQGHWVNWELWPIDWERYNRAREARVGT